MCTSAQACLCSSTLMSVPAGMDMCSPKPGKNDKSISGNFFYLELRGKRRKSNYSFLLKSVICFFFIFFFYIQWVYLFTTSEPIIFHLQFIWMIFFLFYKSLELQLLKKNWIRILPIYFSTFYHLFFRIPFRIVFFIFLPFLPSLIPLNLIPLFYKKNFWHVS